MPAFDPAAFLKAMARHGAHMSASYEPGKPQVPANLVIRMVVSNLRQRDEWEKAARLYRKMSRNRDQWEAMMAHLGREAANDAL